ncbi:hypothetical protein G6F46_007012 [Rhizopus delemar]|uniref:ARID domain-containing protein n=2 Tax=Rhizopus TaxID=4842 RepID=A0A9P7CNZ5_9FUNG|nr:hypothetical protein G6F55_008470 [Rhizopus delemar]KAG1542192.1 hypothetical protein G6F51_007428 [Rhizopus arrhizus]KAG1496805.1 hypothetical protein G6F54_006219 [Rhizopus delemar]KAG1511837.1 hypothetical protein G6F53_005642 [Rhizopus delemar]KAG1521743.1 hypothetical protein G6F52_006469 [Rhizopus delemar]
MVHLPDTIDRTPEYVKFIQELQQFHESKGTRLVAEPVLGGRRLDLYKIFQVVVDAGGFDEVTKNRGWKQVGNLFNFRSTCTNSAYILKGVYIRNLLGYEEEKVWNKAWQPPKELLGPHAHRASTLAGKAYRQVEKKTPTRPKKPSSSNALVKNFTHNHVTEKDRILFALQFGRKSDIEWALNQVVQYSFECPQKIDLGTTPLLLETLISLAETGLMQLATAYHARQMNYSVIDQIMGENDHEHHDSSPELSTVLKVLHTLRNFSFIKECVIVLSHAQSVNNVILQSLEIALMAGHVEIGRHSVDILENIAPHIQLVSNEDPFLVSLYKLIAAHDRYMLIGSIRTLTWLSVSSENHTHLAHSPVLELTSQMLLADDEELVGTVLEYTYQYVKISAECRREFLKLCHGGVFNLLIALLLTKSKYFTTRFVQQDWALLSPDSAKMFKGQTKSAIPRMPDLTIYHNLDEPFRCLGWLKDKFEVADQSSILSIDDIYMLYEARFRLEKALKMKDFYTVIKIAFSSAYSKTCPQKINGPVIQGLDIIGIQMKTNILQDRKSPLKVNAFTLQKHVFSSHISSTGAEEEYYCQWSSCAGYSSNKDAFLSHLQTHVYIPETRCPSPELSSSPSTPSSSSSLESIESVDCNQDVQGIALAACSLLDCISQDPEGAGYLKPFEKELNSIAESRPRLAGKIWSICTHFS